MERLMEDAVSVKNLLPWIDSDEDIIRFMRKIPLDKSHLRNQLTVRYFIKKRDCYSNDFEKEIEDDAREIVIVMPDTSYKEIKEKLSVLGNIPNRKEVVIRQLLHKKRDLDKVLREINVSTVKKRKSDSPNDIFGLDSESHTNINIKIRKVDGSLEVVSRISSQDKPSTSKVLNVVDEHIEEAATSSTSVTSSTSNSSNSSADSTVPSTTTETDDPFPELTAVINDAIKSSASSTSEPIMATRASAGPSVTNNAGCADASNRDLFNVTLLPNPKEELVKSDVIVREKHIVKESKFNLIDFVKELSLASEYRIYQLCKQMRLDLNKRPREDQLNYLLNQLLDDVVEIKSADSSDSANNSETEDCDYNDLLTGFLPQHPYSKASQQRKVNSANKSSIMNANAKEFKLKEPVLTLPLLSLDGTDSFAASKQISLAWPGSSVIQPARFNPTSSKENTIPAMPNRFLAALQARAHQEEEAEDEPVPIDDESLASVNLVPGLLEVVEDMIVDNVDANNDGDGTALNLTTKTAKEFAVQNKCCEPIAGPSSAGIQKKNILDQNLVLRLIEMFPEACPDYVRQVCGGKQWADLDDLVTVILSAPNYPKRPERIPSPPKEVDPEEQYEIIKELLPDADPTYLRMQCETFANNEKGLKEFINQAMEMKDYPTMKEYLRKQQISAQQKQYTTEFNIDNFIHLFPDPEKMFSDPKKNLKLGPYSVHYVNTYFKNRYDKIPARIIQQTLIETNFKIFNCDKIFATMIKRNNTMKSKRKHLPLPENLENIPLLQELAYLTHREEIKKYLLEKQKKEEQERVEAKQNGLMEICQCCYDEDVMPKDTFKCPNGCKFCRECIKKSCEVAFGEGKTDFPCLAACSTEFTLQTLQSVLPPKMFSKLAQKKALVEIKAAGIEELETCPFCDFASIPNESDKIFRCLNPDCMKESCRKCKEPNHVPLKCEEVEKDQDVKARTYIENKMTEALLRKCWKCGTSFFKEEGCNKMTCSCGASMCYICQEPVKDYSHFNGIGGDKFNLCPLYSDSNLINQQNVLGAAQAAKAEIDPSKLKVDPTIGIKDHFKDRAKKLPREPHMEVLHRVHQHAQQDYYRRLDLIRPNHHHETDEQMNRAFIQEIQRMPAVIQQAPGRIRLDIERERLAALERLRLATQLRLEHERLEQAVHTFLNRRIRPRNDPR